MKKFLHSGLLLLVAFLSFSNLQAQRTVSGTVKDGATKEALIGASVLAKGTTIGTVTDVNGAYTLTFPNGVTELVVTFVGYANKTVLLGTGKSLDIALDAGTDLDNVIVIGSRNATRTKLETPVPVDVIPISSIVNEMGQVDINQILNYIAPSFQSARQTISDGTDHQDPAQLRGLGPDQVLVLINGKRRHQGALVNVNGTVNRGTVGTDMNAIPVSAIDRIEILRDGAAAQYGSDAIAGVVNIVLKKSAGLSVNTSYGSTLTEYQKYYAAGKLGLPGYTTPGQSPYQSVSDGKTFQLGLNYGLRIGKEGYLNLTGEYTDRGATNRAGLYTGQIWPSVGGVDRSDSINASRGIDRSTFDMRIGNSAIKSGGVAYNLSLPFGNNGWDFYSFGGYNKKNGESGGTYRYPNAVPAAARAKVLALYPNGFLPLISTDITDIAGTIGVRGKIGEWHADLSQTLGQNEFKFGVNNSVNYSAAADTTGRFATLQQSFDAGGLKFTQATTNFDISRNTMLGDAPLSLALGAEYRTDIFDIRAGEEGSYQIYQAPAGIAPGSQVYPGFFPSDAGSHSRNNFALYTDNELDLTPWWMVSGALRFENYSDFGSTLNYKVASRVKVTDKLTFRVSGSTGFRAPSQQQKYFSKTNTLFIGSSTTPTQVATLTNESAAAQLLGIPQLKQETSQSIAGGITARPDDDIELTLDAYHIHVDNRIVLTNNFDARFFTDPTIKSQLIATGATQVNFFSNSVNTNSDGIEGVVNYKTDLGTGRLKLIFAGSLIMNSIEKDSKGIPIINASSILKANNQLPYYFNREDQSRIEVASPSSKFSATFNYKVDKFSMMVRGTHFGVVRYLDAYLNSSTNLYGDPANSANWSKNVFDGQVESLDQTFSPKFIVDASMSYELAKGLNLTVGANNLFDTYQDINAHSVNQSSGRFVYSRRVQQQGFNGRYVFARLAFNLK